MDLLGSSPFPEDPKDLEDEIYDSDAPIFAGSPVSQLTMMVNGATICSEVDVL